VRAAVAATISYLRIISSATDSIGQSLTTTIRRRLAALSILI